jgi:hypothetical protein
MRRKSAVSKREQHRRAEQSQRQWEKDNQQVAAALKAMLERPVFPRGWIHFG